ncbi:MAG: kinase [Solirubrobacteraceae bacterium]|nr:kinase [Solirubrobacteraceae bacterium]
MRTIGLVVHPSRDIDRVLDAARAWATDHGATLGQVLVRGQERRVADPVEPGACDLLLAIGGDGTVLAALDRAGPAGTPVLGIACGSLGALTSAKAGHIDEALDRFAAGSWEARTLTGLRVARDGTPLDVAVNDLVVIRRGSGQVILSLDVDGGLYARTAGDGVVVATALGSSAYTIAAGGPLLGADHDGMVVTPLADHAGSVPPLVLTGQSTLSIAVDGGWSGARVELDGRILEDHTAPGEQEPFRLEIGVEPHGAKLLDFDGETRMAGLRRRGVIADSPRLRARDARGG